MKKNNHSYEPEIRKGLTEEEINSPEFNPDDFAPAPDAAAQINENEKIENKRNSLVFAFVVAFLALIVGLLSWATMGAFEKYSEDSLKSEILSCFSNCDRVEEYAYDSENMDVYAVFFRNKIAGYCIHTSFNGFAGDIEMLIAFDSGNEICKIKVLSHSESKGYGSKIAEDDFLMLFEGALIGDKDFNPNDYMMSGATVSATAVKDEVRRILGLSISTSTIAEYFKVETITAAEIEEEVQKEEAEKQDPEQTQKVPTETTGPSDISGPDEYLGGSNINNGDGDMSVDGTDVTTVYDTETEEPNEEETTEKEETSAPSKVETTVPDTKEETTEVETTRPGLIGGNTRLNDETTSETTTPDTEGETTVPEPEIPEETTGEAEESPVEPVDNSQSEI